MNSGAERDSSQELKQQLIKASGAGNLQAVKHLIEGMKVQHNTCRDSDGCTSLNYACLVLRPAAHSKIFGRGG